MKTGAITIIITLAALTVVLNPSLTGIGVPAPYAPFLVYQIWEIPIVAVFLLFGPKYGISVAVLNALVLLAIFIGPGGLPSGPFYNLIAVLSMLLGVYIVHKVFAIKTRQKTQDSVIQYGPRLITTSTTLGITLRVAIMTLVNYVVLRYSYPIGYSMPQGAILATLPLIALFNGTLALYTVPLGHVVANAISRTAKSQVKL